MSNILIIKHGSLGDIVQISGVLRDIREYHKDKKIFILTTRPYIELLGRCPYLDGALLDKRLPRWNVIYLMKLKKSLKKYNFSHVYDLQNSSRTSFYRRFLFNVSNWSSTDTKIKSAEQVSENESVLERFKIQLNNSNVETKYTLKPDFSWACINVDKIVNKFLGKKYILFFPFCSPGLSHKKWPYFNELANIIKSKHSNFEIAIAPAPQEMEEAMKIDSLVITNNKNSLDIMELAGLISKASYVVANDTGPAHMAAHLNKEGTVLFGKHTTAKKVSIETDKFKAISVEDLHSLSAEKVYLEINKKLDLID